MSSAGALDLASGLGGKIDKSDVLSAVDKYEKYHVCYGGEEQERKDNYTDMVNKYYDLVTSFYEYGWGESFHFAPRVSQSSLLHNATSSSQPDPRSTGTENLVMTPTSSRGGSRDVALCLAGL